MQSRYTTARSLWLAGLGAAGVVLETATGAFDALVERGRRAEPRAIAAAHQAGRDARRAAGELAGSAARASRRQIDNVLDAVGIDNRPRRKNLLHRLGDLAEAIL